MFSGEALDLAKPTSDHVMQVYVAGCSTLLESLSAQLYVNCLSDETKATIDPEYMAHICKDNSDIENEIKVLTASLVGVGTEKKARPDQSGSVWMTDRL